MKNILLFLLFIVFSSHAQTIPDDDFLYDIADSVWIPLPDGQKISATVVKKNNVDAALPVVLFYTTYSQGRNDRKIAKRLADRDYVGVIAYTRGIRGNLAEYVPYENEATDSYEIIDWISKQKWCNGKVGMYGGSYTGYSQWAAARKLHPALQTIVPQVAVMPGYDFPMENDVPIANILQWPNDILKFPPLDRGLVFQYFDNGVAFQKLDSLAGQPNRLFQKWLRHPAYDSYWQSLAPTPKEYAEIDIPVLTTTGYYDGCQISALRYFKQHMRYNRNANHYLVIGPYDHWSGQRHAAPELMGYKIDPVAQISMQQLAFDWLDYILKDGKKPALLKDKVNYEVMGSNQWKSAPSIEKMSNRSLTFYFDNGLLSQKKPRKNSPSLQKVDFKNREDQNAYYTPNIVFDTLDVSNGLVFRSDIFEKEFSINGAFEGKLYATLNKKDLDVSMALYEQTPDGRYFFLTRYVGRASYARNPSKRQLLKPGKKETIPFSNTRLVSKQISKGSRLVILLNVNKHPFEIINYGSGKEPAVETVKDAGEPLQIQWHNDSRVQIPIWE
ncbi:CocE/NonD family hydrolase [Flavobacterium sp.]|uniref:CocE/NonD family hydrolase n=1 Tax=Flavobacterium sp. TaxID=239 RepID=UPI0039E2176C